MAFSVTDHLRIFMVPAFYFHGILCCVTPLYCWFFMASVFYLFSLLTGKWTFPIKWMQNDIWYKSATQRLTLKGLMFGPPTFFNKP